MRFWIAKSASIDAWPNGAATRWGSVTRGGKPAQMPPRSTADQLAAADAASRAPPSLSSRVSLRQDGVDPAAKGLNLKRAYFRYLLELSH